jgi:hypothetical protein
MPGLIGAYEADYDRIRDKIEAVFPDLFANFNKRVRQPGGFHLTNPPRERVWKTATGRANFIVFPGVREDEPVADPAMLSPGDVAQPQPVQHDDLRARRPLPRRVRRPHGRVHERS